jgi:lysophospholipase L1-like esterase
MHRLFRHGLLFWPSLPLVLPQALWLKLRAARAEPAQGERRGCFAGCPHRPALRVLGVGDSPFEGVGIERIDDTLPVQLARRLGERYGRRVEWTLLARNGADVRALRAMLDALSHEPAFDFMLVSVGVNDVTGLTIGVRFRRELGALLQALRAHSPQARIVLLGIPPMQCFPLLPQPLRAWLGGSHRLELIGHQTARGLGVLHAPIRFDLDPELFAADGFHPSVRGHQRWVDVVLEHLDAAETDSAGGCPGAAMPR